jgi:hypothetical protein
MKKYSAKVHNLPTSDRGEGKGGARLNAAVRAPREGAFVHVLALGSFVVCKPLGACWRAFVQASALRCGRFLGSL